MNLRRRILATDLDGTLIPLGGNQQNRLDLITLTELLHDQNYQLIFVTGRHLASIIEVSDQHQLPIPDWIICDVGTSIFQRRETGSFEPVTEYLDHQERIIAALPIGELRERLKAIDGLRLQEEEKQGRFKLSFYTASQQLDELVNKIEFMLKDRNAPFSIIHSVDPFNGDGLIDLLPVEVSKAYALRWWSQHLGVAAESILFAGDSGNDLAAMTSGYHTVVVGNADRGLIDTVRAAHRSAGWTDRLMIADGKATTGVLEGWRWFMKFR